MKIAILSDTHNLLRPEVIEILKSLKACAMMHGKQYITDLHV